MNKAKTIKKTGGIKLPPVKIPDTLPPKGFPLTQDEIEKLKQLSKEKLVFSLRFFDRNHQAFNLGRTKEDWFISLLDTLKEVSSLNRNQLVVEQRQHYDAHPHDWSRLDYIYTFCNADFLEQVECMQFSLATSKGRVHGFIIGNRFYVVWLDPHHNLYPDDKHGGRKFYERPLTSYEVLLIEKERIEQENKGLLEMLDLQTKP